MLKDVNQSSAAMVPGALSASIGSARILDTCHAARPRADEHGSWNWFIDGAEAFHLNPRPPRDSRAKPTLVMNSRSRDNQWGREEVVPLPQNLLNVFVVVDTVGYRVYDEADLTAPLHVFLHRVDFEGRAHGFSYRAGWSLYCDVHRQSPAAPPPLTPPPLLPLPASPPRAAEAPFTPPPSPSFPPPSPFSPPPPSAPVAKLALPLPPTLPVVLPSPQPQPPSPRPQPPPTPLPPPPLPPRPPPPRPPSPPPPLPTPPLPPPVIKHETDLSPPPLPSPLPSLSLSTPRTRSWADSLRADARGDGHRTSTPKSDSHTSPTHSPAHASPSSQVPSPIPSGAPPEATRLAAEPTASLAAEPTASLAAQPSHEGDQGGIEIVSQGGIEIVSQGGIEALAARLVAAEARAAGAIATLAAERLVAAEHNATLSERLHAASVVEVALRKQLARATTVASVLHHRPNTCPKPKPCPSHAPTDAGQLLADATEHAMSLVPSVRACTMGEMAGWMAIAWMAAGGGLLVGAGAMCAMASTRRPRGEYEPLTTSSTAA